MSRNSETYRRRPSYHTDRGGNQDTGSPKEDTTILVEDLKVDLRNRPLAAFLAWLVPGLGHAYQHRYQKAATFFVAIMSLWIFGFAIGGQHVVYASWQPSDKRWHFAFQAGAGAVSIPAVIQGRKMNQFTNEFGATRPDYRPVSWLGDFMAPPFRPVQEEEADQVASWYAIKGAGYEMGTWYTVIAGLLNILVIYDAYGGPLSTSISGRRRVDGKKDPDEDDQVNAKEILDQRADQESQEMDQKKLDQDAKSDAKVSSVGSES